MAAPHCTWGTRTGGAELPACMHAPPTRPVRHHLVDPPQSTRLRRVRSLTHQCRGEVVRQYEAAHQCARTMPLPHRRINSLASLSDPFSFVRGHSMHVKFARPATATGRDAREIDRRRCTPLLRVPATTAAGGTCSPFQT
jgi:hypothetical protein